MYHKTARYYDKIYAFKDYAEESRRLIERIEEELGPGRHRLLDVACGTGAHLVHLREAFEVEGLDRTPELLEIARERLPSIRFHCADMRDFRLESRYDVVTCLFSSIGYMTTGEDLASAIRTMADHLTADGILIVEPWITPDAWFPNTVHSLFVDEPELKIARINTSAVSGRLSIFDLHYLIGTPEGTEHVIEHHEMGLFTVEEMTAAFEAAGLGVTCDPRGLTGRGLYVARKEARG